MSTENNIERGLPIVIAGPSGVGKGTIISKILESNNIFTRSRSATTRMKRVGDPNEVKYIFISREEFIKKMADGDIIEHNLYQGEYYGTLASQTECSIESGKHILFDIDVNGALALKKLYSETILIWLMPESFSELDSRLHNRNTETEEKIRGRLEKARTELEYFDKFDYIVINKSGKIDNAVQDILSIIRSEQLRVSRNKDFCVNFVKNINI